MDYNNALNAGKISLVLVLAASLYYLLRTLLAYCTSHKIDPNITKVLRSLVMYARMSHPYLGALIPFGALYHGYKMWSTNGSSFKAWLGIATIFALLCMAGIGVLLKFKPANKQLRLKHRLGALLLVMVMMAHRFA